MRRRSRQKDSALSVAEKKLRSAWSEAGRRMFRLTAPTSRTRTKAGVGLIIRDRSGRILIERRSDCGLWGLPGGRIEPGESIVDASLREVKEETGLAIRVVGLQGVYAEARDRIVCYPDNGDQRQLIDIAVTARVIGGRLRKSDESLELRWVRKDEVPWAFLCPAARTPLRDAFAGRMGVLG